MRSLYSEEMGVPIQQGISAFIVREGGQGIEPDLLRQFCRESKNHKCLCTHSCNSGSAFIEFDNPIHHRQTGPLCRCIDAAAGAVVGVIDVLEDGRGFLLEELRRVGPRQAFVQELFDGDAHLGPGLLPFAPIEHQLSRLQRGQQLPVRGLDLLPVRVATLRPGVAE